MREPQSNVGFVHGECIDARKAETQEVLRKVPLSKLIGRHVKLAFECNGPNGKPMHEHMWVRVQSVAGTTRLSGILDNDPRYATHLSCGNVVTFEKSEIEQFL